MERKYLINAETSMTGSQSKSMSDKGKTKFRKYKQKETSDSSVSVQLLKLPKEFEKKPTVHVPLLHEKTAANKRIWKSSTSSTQRKTGSEATNLHYKGWGITSQREYGTCTKNVATQSALEKLKDEVPESKFSTSLELNDSFHEHSEKPEQFRGLEWAKPPKESYVAGAPRTVIGKCPKNIEKMGKLSLAKQKFFLTQDPRKNLCLANPDVLSLKSYTKEKEVNYLTDMVKKAKLTIEPEESKLAETKVCKVMDLVNPLNLDFQGVNYRETFEGDEQDIQYQRTFLKISRHMEQKRVAKETVIKVENEIMESCLSIPPFYDVKNREPSPEPEIVPEPKKYLKLLRTEAKELNKERIDEEDARRWERNEKLYKDRMKRMENERIASIENEKQALRDKARMISKRNLANTTAAIKKDFEYSLNIKQPVKIIPPDHIPQKYPHTLVQARKLNKKFKVLAREKRNEAQMRKDFYSQKFGVVKNYPEADLEISSLTGDSIDIDTVITEDSSHDEDAITVGREIDVFKVRGFHYKMGENVRGKTHQIDKLKGAHTVKGCITREQWLQEITTKPQSVKVDVKKLRTEPTNPDDPKQELFSSFFAYKPPKAKHSPIKRYREKKLGDQYERTLYKQLKIIKPHLKRRKKTFNLIGFLYGKNAKIKNVKQEEIKEEIQTTIQYMQEKALKKKQDEQEAKKRIISLLGTSTHIKESEPVPPFCERTDSSSSDWVPETEDEAEELKERPTASHSFINRVQMPAPKHRQTTTRRHPRKPREYVKEDVPPELFTLRVKETGIPHMRKIGNDKMKYQNVRLKNTQYAKLAHARHHHDHWEPTHTKRVIVHHQHDVTEIEDPVSHDEKNDISEEDGRNAETECKIEHDWDATRPFIDTEAMLAEHRRLKKLEAEARLLELGRKPQEDEVYHTRTARELKSDRYGGRRKYIEFLNELAGELKKQKTVETKIDPREEEKRKAIYAELEEDLKSVDTCLSSLESSECTNFTDDSGTFIIIHGDTKVPLDYIRKANVPFDEKKQSLFHFKPINREVEEANPFRVVPFSGQKHSQLEMVVPKENFHTFNTRLRNSIRLRLEVPNINIRETLVGFGNKQYLPLVATDIDENFVKDLKKSSVFTHFRFKSLGSIIKDGLRLKIQSMVINEFIVRWDVINRLNDKFFDKMKKITALYERLFEKWEQQQYERTTSIVYQVQSYYEQTDIVKRELRWLERQLQMINLDIAFIEGHWIRLIVLQNFFYLIAEKEWRDEFDWIHRVSNSGEEVELERYDISIQNRNIVNIRKRDRDDAWAIKDFYENVYLQQNHPIILPYKDSQGLIKGIASLKKMTFIALLELHLNLALHYDIKSQLINLRDWCNTDLREKIERVAHKCARKYFMISRAEDLRQRATKFVNETMAVSYCEEVYVTDGAYVEQVWEYIVPLSIRGASKKKGGGKKRALAPVQMVAMMSDVIIDLIGKFEAYPSNIIRACENYFRQKLHKLKKISYNAQQIEYRVEAELKVLRKNMEPLDPKHRPCCATAEKKKEYILAIPKKERPPKIIEKKVIPDKVRFMFHAFHDDTEDIENVPNAGMSVITNLDKQVAVEFYFDYFLSLNGYTPNYNFKTQVELRDGPEINRMNVEEVLPEIVDRLGKWEETKQKIMEESILRNRHMYENVQF
ncbi:uncharacterized protein LOC119679498 [Teleopsis dalmanni]|uniref:uncharacterized protein LOC119679498 n=1 Tax=Teleopsis dalmanni TaxID=139649 RepID=UPI0018CE5CEF|nr:uncharacterized protein LOC119679498 [Teleopsis dalmanni]